jgi:hypothetical protein
MAFINSRRGAVKESAVAVPNLQLFDVSAIYIPLDLPVQDIQLSWPLTGIDAAQ